MRGVNAQRRLKVAYEPMIAFVYQCSNIRYFTMIATQSAIFSTSIITLLVTLCILVWIERQIKPQERALSKQRNVLLWKLPQLSKKDKDEMLNIDKWSLRKLWFAGTMIASSLVSVTVRRLGAYSLLIGAIILVLWTSFLLYFWYFEVMKKYLLTDENLSDERLDSWKTMNISPTSTVDAYDANLNKVPIEERDLDSFIKANVVSDESLFAGIRSKSGDKRLPLTIVTGFLGSGKTTLIKKILNNTAGIRILVIENEIGEQGIDHDLLLQQTNAEDIILLNNGCVCCTVRKDIIETFDKIFSDEILASQLDWVIIETTGLANPAPLIQTLYMDKICQSRMRLDSVITVVDSKHFSFHLNPKADDINSSRSYIGGLFHRNDEISEVEQQVLYSDRILLNKIDLVPAEDLKDLKSTIKTINPNADILTCSYGDIDIDLLLNIRAFDPLRNIALLDKPKPLFQIPIDDSGKILQKEMKFGVSSSSSKTKFHSISLVGHEALDLDKVNAWISTLLETKGKDIYRLKGILSIHGYDEIFVAHGIHMIFDGQLGEKWADTQSRQSKLVFIGMNLSEETLKIQFDSCIYRSS